MNAFEIYLMFKANDIQTIFTVIATLTCIGLGILLIIYLINTLAQNMEPDENNALLLKKGIKYFIFVVIPSLFIATFTPSTQTIAAMYILPKLTSPEAIKVYKEEGGELYTLTKQALQSLITTKPEQDQTKNK